MGPCVDWDRLVLKQLVQSRPLFILVRASETQDQQMSGNIAIIVLSILMSSSAHVCLKKGMMVHGAAANSSEGLFNQLFLVAVNPWILGGMFLHVSALVVWLYALSRVDITFAYPFLALGYVLVSLAAWLWLDETIGPTKLLAMAIIVIGILILSRAE